MSKYSKYVNPLRLWTEMVAPAYRGNRADFSLMFDEQVYPDTPVWIETFHLYGPGSGAIPSEYPVYFKGKVQDMTGIGQHSHNDFDELFLFYGTNPYDNTRLGGEVEFWLGHGEDAQKFIINEPTVKWVPAGLAHNPWTVLKVDDPKYPIILNVIAFTHRYSSDDNTTRDSINYPLPPGFGIENFGKPFPGKGLYNQYVKKIPFADDRVFPWHRGRVAVPTLMFDAKVIPNVPLWAEIFHVYAGGSGIGIPNLEARQWMPDGSVKDLTKGYSNNHSFDEIFLFLPTNPHDTLNLGGEVNVWLGDTAETREKFAFTKSTGVYVPGNMFHNPQYFKRVDRPFIMLVLALTNNYFSSSKDWIPLPSDFEW
jgi:hypothetical protein